MRRKTADTLHGDCGGYTYVMGSVVPVSLQGLTSASRRMVDLPQGNLQALWWFCSELEESSG